MLEPIKKLLRTLKSYLDRFVDGELTGVPRPLFAFVFVIWLAIQVGRKTVRDRCLLMASSLAYKTILALVPMLAVGFAMLKAFGVFERDPHTGAAEAGAAAAGFYELISSFIPVQGEVIAEHIQRLAEGISVGAVGLVGIATLGFVGISLFLNTERVFNDIYGAQIRRGLFQRFTTFWALITLGPTLVTISVYYTTQMPAAQFASLVAPTLLTFGALLLAYKLLPNTTVRWHAAAIGALLGAILFELAKFGFRYYVVAFVMKKVTATYGALALFPIFLIWIYVAWLTVLIGCEIAHTTQNIHVLTEQERVRRTGAEGPLALMRRLTPRFAARAYLFIAARYARGEGAVRLEELRDAMAATDREVSLLAQQLREAGLLVNAVAGEDDDALLPARPLHRVLVADVVSAVSQDAFTPGDDGEVPAKVTGALDDILGVAEQHRFDDLRKTSFADLVDQLYASRSLPAATTESAS